MRVSVGSVTASSQNWGSGFAPVTVDVTAASQDWGLGFGPVAAPKPQALTLSSQQRIDARATADGSAEA